MRFRHVLTPVLIVTFCPLFCRGDLSEPGPFPVGSTTVTVTRPDSSTFSALFYYPATTGGPDAPLKTDEGPYSAVTFGHGYLQQPTRYARTLEHLASYGHLVIATTSRTGLFPNHSEFAGDLRLTLDYLTDRGADPDDALFELVDTEHFGLFGHSMGAGAGLLAAADDSRIKAYAGLATAITNPSPEPRMSEIAVPVALLSGDEDGIVDYTTATVPLYEAATGPKLQPLIQGGYHVGFQDDPFPLFPDSGSLPAEDQLATTRSYLTSYFGLYLRNDQSLWRNIWGPEAFAEAGLPTEADPGMKLTTETPEREVAPGKATTFQITVTNTGPDPVRFSLFTEDSVWDVSLEVAHTPTLEPAEQFQFDLQVLAPPGVPEGAGDTVLLSARNETDGGTRDYLTLKTEAVPEPGVLLSSILGVAIFTTRRKGRSGHFRRVN